MDFQTILILAQDAITNSAIYALLALALILVFGVTRVIFVAQGEFVSYGALTLASLQTGVMPGTVWLLLILAFIAACMETARLLVSGARHKLPGALATILAPPLAIAALVKICTPLHLHLGWQLILTMLIVIPLGPLIYRVAFRPLADATVLVLLIAAVAVHFVLVGLGLLFFGAEGVRTPPFSDAQFTFANLNVSGQSLCVYATTIVFVAIMAWFFNKTLYGKALRAVAFNRNGARLVGITPHLAGTFSFALASAIGCLSGLLIGPITTLYYDSGFLIGLKGFVGAIVGGMASYPIAAAGALMVGFSESFSSFWLSGYKDVVVFTMIIPVLLWRSLTTAHYEEEE
ncbi:MAG: branched-chain amino acid ABC transporter permease [Desulfuromonadaceae bacterium]|nr:branched-chain amino acid ABC transporter permease [Desulfuromonadaceae bacterium]